MVEIVEERLNEITSPFLNRLVELNTILTPQEIEALKDLLATHNIPFEATDVDLLAPEKREELLLRMAPHNRTTVRSRKSIYRSGVLRKNSELPDWGQYRRLS